MGFFYDKEYERQRLEQQRRLAELNREDEDDEDVGSIRRRALVNKRRPPVYDDDDDEEDYYDPEEALIRLLKRIGSIRDQLDQTQGQLSDLLQKEPELHQQYHRFIAQGGVTHEDFERFQLNLLRPRLIRSKRHLRLVTTSKVVKRSKRPRLTPIGGDDDDAA